MGKKWAHDGPKIGVSRVFARFCHYFFGESNLKWKIWWFSFSLCKPHTWENSDSQVTGKNYFVESGSKILWSSVYLEGINWYLRFFSLLKDHDWGYYFWLVVARVAQPRPNMPILTRLPLIDLGCVASLKIAHNERLINF